MSNDLIKEAKTIREELSFIGRYQDGISPKLSKYKELEERKVILRKRLKEISIPDAGSNPKKFKGKSWHRPIYPI